MFIRNGILYHKSGVNHPDRSTMQLVLLKTLRKQALQGCHNNFGHLRIITDDRSLKGSFLLAHNA